jgi:hypothetical protein
MAPRQIRMEILIRQKATRRPSLSHRLTAISMSALGHKRTLRRVRAMSALPPKADMDRACGDVRFVPKADICTPANNRWSKLDAEVYR